MKDHVWFNYRTSGEIIEIIVRDWSEGKLDSWKVNAKDTKKIKKVFKIIKEKYNINLFMDFKEEDKDIEWIP